MKLFLQLFLFFACIYLPAQLYSQDQEAREAFSKAYPLYAQGNRTGAEFLFAQTLDRGFALEDYSLYFLGLIRVSAKDWANGRGYLALLKQKFPDSIWSSQADLYLAKISLEERDYQRALGELRALQGLAGKKDVAEHAAYLLGQAYEMQGDLKSAYTAYQELRQTAPLSPRARDARRQVRKIAEQQPDWLASRNSFDSLVAEADLLLREREYDEAARIYRKLLGQAPEDKQRPRLLMGLANVYRAQRKRDEAIAVLGEIVSRYPDSADAPHALYRLAITHWNRDDNLQALEHFNRLKQRYPRSPFIDFSQFASARIHETLGQLDQALDVYGELPKRFPNSKWGNEALWRQAWIHYIRSDYKKAYSFFRLLAALPSGEGYKNSALYWQGRTAEKLERPAEAKRLFLQILASKEDTYYRGPAETRLAQLGAPTEVPKAVSSVAIPEPVPPLQPNFAFHLTRAQELARISLSQFAIHELDEIQNLARGDLPLSIALIREYAKIQAYSRTLALSGRIELVSEELDRYRYPMAYWDTIQKLAQEKNVDPLLVLALIRQESAFDTRALSPASAYGLMQLLPSTAARTASQMGLSSPQPESLFEPNVNLVLGIQHLKDLLDMYPNHLVKAIAAYNAGQNAVTRWEQQIATDDPEEFIERIPYAETRLYVKLVLRNQLNYRRIYGNSR